MKILHPCAIVAVSAIALTTSIRAESTGPVAARADKPNIILCMTDDLGWGDVSYNGQMKERPQPIGFWDHSGPAAWMDNRYKLHKLPGDKYELYDITSDISEKSEIAAGHPEIVARMKAELEAWQQSVLHSNRGEDYPEKKVLESAIPQTK